VALHLLFCDRTDKPAAIAITHRGAIEVEQSERLSLYD
jgi:hypothetical protein